MKVFTKFTLCQKWLMAHLQQCVATQNEWEQQRKKKWGGGKISSNISIFIRQRKSQPEEKAGLSLWASLLSWSTEEKGRESVSRSTCFMTNEKCHLSHLGAHRKCWENLKSHIYHQNQNPVREVRPLLHTLHMYWRQPFPSTKSAWSIPQKAPGMCNGLFWKQSKNVNKWWTTRWPMRSAWSGKNIITLNKVQLLVKALHTNNQIHEKPVMDGKSWDWGPVGDAQVGGK